MRKAHRIQETVHLNIATVKSTEIVTITETTEVIEEETMIMTEIEEIGAKDTKGLNRMILEILAPLITEVAEGVRRKRIEEVLITILSPSRHRIDPDQGATSEN